MHPDIIETMLRERREDLLREAERQRLILLYEAVYPSASKRLLAALGQLLIDAGEKLLSRYDITIQTTPPATRAGILKQRRHT